ncbi:MAG: MarR family transcriptional regulator [Chloroflexi bacterium]|nr:MarR family transcriptional regulator [Chloroflexota bacterium]
MRADDPVVVVQQLVPALRRSLRPRLSRGTKDLPVSPAQLQLLLTVEQHDNPAVSDLAAQLGISFSTVTEKIDKLVSIGYLKRTKSRRDRRKTLISLTEASFPLVQAALAEQRSWLAQVLHEFTVEEQAVVLRFLRALARS